MAARPGWDGPPPLKTRLLLRGVGLMLEGGEEHPLYTIAERILRTPNPPPPPPPRTVDHAVSTVPRGGGNVTLAQSTTYCILFYMSARVSSEVLKRLEVTTPTSRTALRLLLTASIFNITQATAAALNERKRGNKEESNLAIVTLKR